MADLTDAHHAAARRLLEQEGARTAFDGWAAAAGHVYQVLAQQLSPVLGSLGMRALLARSLKLNRGKFPWLAGFRMPSEPEGGDEQLTHALSAAFETVDRERGMEAASAVYATLFALLTNFIGERLTWQIVQHAFTEDGTASKETE